MVIFSHTKISTKFAIVIALGCLSVLGVASFKDIKVRMIFACIQLRITSTLPFLRGFMFRFHQGTSVAQVCSGTLPNWKCA